MSDPQTRPRRMSRRQVLGAAAVGAGAIALGDYAFTRGSHPSMMYANADHVLRPRASTIDLGTRQVRTQTYGGQLPGPTLRLKQGRPVRIRVDNELGEETSVHWHGIRLHNAADGVPGLTQQPIGKGESHLYEFTPPDAGTYLFHSHSGLQLDRGLYGALIVEASDEAGSYDHDEVIVLDDWLDGIAGTPDEALARLLKHGMTGMSGSSGSMSGMSGMSMGSGAMMSSAPLSSLNGGARTGPYRTITGARPDAGHLAGLANLMASRAVDIGDVSYPMHLINGRDNTAPWTLRARSGDRARLRFINAGADTTYLVYVEGHELTVTHADGLAIRAVKTQALVLGQGERYDAVIDIAAAGRIVAVALGKRGRGEAHLTVDGRAPSAAVTGAPTRVLSYEDLHAVNAPVAARSPRSTRLDLGMAMPYRWTMGGKAFDDAAPVKVSRGEPQRIVMRNTTMMPHPMHLHGYSFAASGTAAVKDTIIVAPLAQVAIDFTPDRAGQWAFHCHNAYHMGAGMMRKVVVS